MKMKRHLALMLCVILSLSCFSNPALAAKKEKKPEVFPPSGNLEFTDAISRELNVTIDGEALKVTQYEDYYLAEPLSTEQRISIYVPETATKDSPVILCVNNAGWMANSYSSRTKVAKDDPETVAAYSANDDKDKVGMILSRGYILVSYGCRGRNDKPGEDGLYLGHSPATVADTKAVIRYLRQNDDLLPAGDLDRIIITGTSGGGALSTLIAACGDSTDFFPFLYEIGAAGIEKEGETYISTLSDSVFAVIAYCPITDLPNADAAYEWTYADTRLALQDIDFNNDPEGKSLVFYTTGDATVNEEVSAYLSGLYADYVDNLGLKLDDGTPLTSQNLKESIIGLMEEEIEESVQEIGKEQMTADIEEGSKNEKEDAGAKDWLVLNEDGTFTYDFAKHLSWVAANNKLKVVCAFSNRGLPWSATNEDTLFGTAAYEYSAFEAYSWDHDSVEGNGSGLDDTGLTWEEFMATEEGRFLALQMRMSNTIEYLNDTEGDDAGVKASYWYVRYGMNDRDSSFAVETILRYSIANNPSVEDMSFEFAWLKPHAGDYDVTEAYTWLDSVLAGTI
ncbi:MAG: hypothetical protein J6T99_09425 [Oscillospiraceae bacterium]|nr:hypothetical protein [Oscillospiraceae bacterium]MBO7728623.1 hypothetical protein [Oscillospiraceae bacterium]